MSSVAEAPTRMAVVWCGDWPVVALGAPLDRPAAVVHANRVVACTPAARTEGVAVGLRRREAQSRCPGMAVHERDLLAEARAFEPVAEVVEQFTPRFEMTVPGSCSLHTRGPSRYFGGDQALAGRMAERIGEVLAGRGWFRIGVADGFFAARSAARMAASAPCVIPPGESPGFLAPLPIGTLERPGLTDVISRLGLRTLGDLAGLPRGDVIGRFGREGEEAHRLASGLDPRPPAVGPPLASLEVATEIDPPTERVDQVAFVGKSLADELHAELGRRGLACIRVLIEAETEHGECHRRWWRHEGALSSPALADRVRWQLEGWLNGPTRHRPTAGVIRLALVPDEVVAATGRQLGFWGGETEAAERVTRALARVEGLLEAAAVTVPEWRGGRGPAEQVDLVPAGTVDLTADRTVERGGSPPISASAARAVPARTPPATGGGSAPWPGVLPAPAPALVHPEPVPVALVDARGEPVGVSGRLVLSAPPARLAVRDGPVVPIEAWAGPWPADERWWDPERRRRRARFQVITTEGAAHLLTLEGGRWWLEATYD